MTDEERLLEALELLGHAEREGRTLIRPQVRKEIREMFRSFQPQLKQYGIYRLYWKSGGSSLAAVGGLSDGTLWFAPTNWTGKEPGAIASIAWYSVERAMLLHVRPCEHGVHDDHCLGCAALKEAGATIEGFGGRR